MCFNPQNKKIEKVKIRPKSREILKYLYINTGLTTTNQIAQYVDLDKIDVITNPDNIKACICDLRKILNPNGENPKCIGMVKGSPSEPGSTTYKLTGIVKLDHIKTCDEPENYYELDEHYIQLRKEGYHFINEKVIPISTNSSNINPEPSLNDEETSTEENPSAQNKPKKSLTSRIKPYFR